MTTKRVRIAVAINERGQWTSAGWQFGDEAATNDELRDDALDGLCGDPAYPRLAGHVVFIDADVPIPETATIQGTVTEAKP